MRDIGGIKMDMNQFETNVVNSFRLAKQDIVKLYESVHYLLNQVEKLKQENVYLTQKLTRLSEPRKVIVKTVKRVANHSVAKKFLATKGGSKVHDTHCPFAKNIKPKNKVVFNSKVKALNAGYKFCKCLN
ncbi:hypothetical protein COY27_05555 [Candidatus Woesearchaeota archaeon CG_4_10_14_0_2_um_filter_33_13]|nr:MAG: hypothetical protein COY27_05555 [Candidatus Woesearchaeota archaeon CG_4_10_14_0_2_um_filter_33_13]